MESRSGFFNSKSNLRLLLLGILSILLSACGGGGGDSGGGGNNNPQPTPDTTAPEITLVGASTLNLEQGTAYSEPGASANDNVDGSVDVDISGSVGSSAGSYTITYSASDSAGNTASTTRTVIVADTIPPVITLNGAAEVSITEGTPYTEDGATATDAVDGTIDVVTSGTVGTQVGSYTITYTATDLSGNSASLTRTVNVTAGVADPQVVYDNGAVDSAWDLGLMAFDEAIQWQTCENDGGEGCPSISWSVVNDVDRGDVLEVTHAPDAGLGAIFTKTSTPYDLSDYAGGTIEFDVKIISGDNNLTMKIDCIYSCTSGDYPLGAVEGSDWVSLSVDINDLVGNGLSLLTIDTGIVIWASDHDSTVFRIDNVRWVANPNGPTTGTGNTGGTISEWVKVDPNNGYSTPAEYPGYTKVWADEFNGTSLNTDDWTFEIGTTDAFGNVGWGNNELQYYREENTYLENGLLVIEARKETYNGSAYTSSRIKTMDKFSFRFGRVDIRAAVAEGKGLWSALWMMGQNWSQEGWPYCGELDIIDTIGGIGQESNVVHNAYWNDGGIGSSYSPANYGNNYDLSGGETFSNTFHVFSIEWTEDSIIWYVDDVQSHAMNIDSDDLREAFQKDFFFIFNVAVGGNWPGTPVTNTQFPRGMLVDYIRVFQEQN